MDRLTAAVTQAIRDAPCSLRALAREAGVSHVQLLRITRGEQRATPSVAEKVAAALAAWSRTCGSAAARIRQAERRRNR